MANNDTNNYQPPSPPDESLGMSLQDKGKQYSVESVKTLDHIQDLKQTYQSLRHQAEQIHKSTDVDNYTSVSRSKSQLAQLLGSIEKLQFSQLDAVSTMHLSSGKSDAKSTRRELNAALDELQEFITSLYARYEALPRPLPAASSVSEGVSEGEGETEGGTKTQEDSEEEAMHKEALRQLMSQAVHERTAHAQHQ